MSVVGSLRRGRRPAVVVAAVVIGVSVAGATTGCSSGSDAAAPSASAPAASPAGETRPDHIAAETFASAMAEDGVVLLDVRTAQEFAEGHLEGARNIDVQAPDFVQQLQALDNSATYLVYCRTGVRSGVAADQLRAAGFADVTGLAGGIVAWQAEGRKVVTG
ncbi:MAG: rhodanese-like domain-containing protein [Actinomycetales bacterium]|nr:rhodanese-like domain-containing protein [Actinomycetales bacterium]